MLVDDDATKTAEFYYWRTQENNEKLIESEKYLATISVDSKAKRKEK